MHTGLGPTSIIFLIELPYTHVHTVPHIYSVSYKYSIEWIAEAYRLEYLSLSYCQLRLNHYIECFARHSFPSACSDAALGIVVVVVVAENHSSALP